MLLSHSNVHVMCAVGIIPGSKVITGLIKTRVKSRDLGIQEAVSICGVSKRFHVY